MSTDSVGHQNLLQATQTTLKNILTHVKDPVSPEEKTGVVYKVPCSD